MIQQKQIRAAYYLRVSTESQELENQRAEIVPFVENRGWRLVDTFEDSMSGRKTEKDRPSFRRDRNDIRYLRARHGT